ncbi:MAG: hypothetical protein ABLQ96_06250 [Candidatus Acidiferrum sp.]
MRRIFSNPVTALVAGGCLRFFFVLHYPAGSGDTVLYEQIATNWLRRHVYAMDIGGVLTPVDTRVPGYPAFLAVMYWLSGKTGADARLWVMSAQVFMDLLTCLVIAAIGAVLVSLGFEKPRPRRAFSVALWMAVLCPFTANYVAVILTETWATFFTALALLLLCLLLLRFRGSIFSVDEFKLDLHVKAEWLAAFAGLAAGLGTLFRPETPLLLIASGLVLGWYLLRARGWLKLFRIGACMFAGCILPLLPWAVRNQITLHKIQFLSPKNSNLPGELIPYGFMAWEKTWLYRVRYSYLVTWKLNDEAIEVEDIPPSAFDSAAEKAQVTEVLASYNQDINLTEEQDAVFGKLASERTARHPLRTYVWIPAARALTVWLTPRIELLPFSGKVFPLSEAWEEDPVDQSFTAGFVALNVIYLLLAAWGAWRLWPQSGARTAVALLVGFVLLRTAFLTTIEAPEPRYTLVCFPVLLALAAQIFAGKDSNKKADVTPAAKEIPGPA